MTVVFSGVGGFFFLFPFVLSYTTLVVFRVWMTLDDFRL
jgi:hypothetical protein